VHCKKTTRRFGQLLRIVGSIPRGVQNIATKLASFLTSNKQKSASSFSEIIRPRIDQENVKDGDFTVEI
jgi:hypothetical protein